MTKERRTPPSERDFDAYTRVVVEQLATPQVALELAISQTRVGQIVVRVGEYMLQVCPAAVSDEDRGRQVYLAQQLAAEQVRFFTRQAYEGFERSIGNQTVVRVVETEGKPKSTISTTKYSPGDLRFLDQATKLALLGAKLPTPNLAGLLPDVAEEVLDEADRAAAREMEEEESEGDSSAEWGQSQPSEDSRLQLQSEEEIVLAEAVENPPNEGCSPAAGEQADEACQDDSGDDANPHYDDTSGTLSDEEAAALHAKIRANGTVQLRLQLLDMGLAEEDMDEFLSSEYGKEAIRKFEPIARRLAGNAEPAGVTS